MTDISRILLVWFDHSQKDDVQKIRKGIEGDQTLVVFDLDDVNHQFENTKPYAEKLKKMLDSIKFAFFVTSGKCSSITEVPQLKDVLKEVDVESDASDVLIEFVAIEHEKGKKDSKLIFLSTGDTIRPPTILEDLEHITNMLVVEDGSPTANDSQIRLIASKCKASVQRPTFATKDDNKKKKDKTCQLM